MKEVKRIVLGTLLALGIYFALCALLAALLVRGSLAEGGVEAWVCVFACVAAFAGATVSTRSEGKRVMPAAACAASLWCALMLLGMLEDRMPEGKQACALALAALFGAALVLLRSGKNKRTRGARDRRRRLRK